MSGKIKRAELVFIPVPRIGHLVSTLEFAKRLIDRDDRLSITVLIMRMPSSPAVDAYVDALASSVAGVRFLDVPPAEPPSTELLKYPESYASVFVENHKPHVKDAIINLLASQSNPPRLAGLVLDLFCTSMIDVAKELSVPSYLFFTSGAAFLGLMLHLPLLDDQMTTDFADSDTELIIPCFANPVPPLVLPSAVLNRNAVAIRYSWYLYHGRRFRETNGIIVNTFAELEPHAVSSLIDDHRTPRLFPVGPVIDVNVRPDSAPNQAHHKNAIKWLENQPPASVVFLCFGSMGSFGAAQVREIALGLERSGYRFLWSLRQPPAPGTRTPTSYTNLEQVLPNGFLERTSGKGVVCDWAPQVEILAHQAIGGFVSHCGWNSILESLWFGVPIVTWPMYAEQQTNAFEMVKELGLAVEMRLDYRMEKGELVVAEEVETGVKRVMEGESEVRRKVKEMEEMSRRSLMVGGSSFDALGRLIEELMEGK